jgi:hypothetical protein
MVPSHFGGMMIFGKKLVRGRVGEPILYMSFLDRVDKYHKEHPERFFSILGATFLIGFGLVELLGPGLLW